MRTIGKTGISPCLLSNNRQGYDTSKEHPLARFGNITHNLILNYVRFRKEIPQREPLLIKMVIYVGGKPDHAMKLVYH